MKRVASGIVPLIPISRNSARPLHRQIYDAYRTAILDGSLAPRQRVPSTRVLASELGVSRFPVLNAYAQLLAEGYLESRVGAGTVVCVSLPEQYMSSKTGRVQSTARRSSARPSTSSRFPIVERPPWLRGQGAFSVGQVAVDEFSLQIWSSLVTRRCRKLDAPSFHYGDPRGSRALREAVATYLRTARSLRCEPEQVMIVSGSQQALAISARVLFDPETHVWFEEPGYSLAWDALTLGGCHLVPVPVDEEGLDVSAGIKRCRNARGAFVTPSHQFPLGATMSATRRLQLLQWAHDAGSWIIEDDYDSEYRYESLPIASLQGLDANSRVIYIGTFSKVLFPSLRLGYVVLPADLVDRFVAIRRTIDLGPPNFFQEVLADFISEGHFARHIRRMRVIYRERRSVLVDSVSRELGSVVEVLGGDAGMHLTITLPEGTRDRDIAERAARQKLWLWPLSSAYLARPARPGFILGFGSSSEEKIPRAVRKLRALLKMK